jgi:single-stranded-DNA-specific exonuclease
MPSTSKQWRLLPHDAAVIDSLSRALNLSPIVAQLLHNRAVRAPEAARRFLTAPLTGLYEPERLPGVPAAAERLLAAARDKRRICIYGDYDVDGVTGTAILLNLLQLLGASVEYYVPHRLEEGYGLNCEALRKLREDGVQLVVTVDCGIGSALEAEEARRLGLELIITDHHEPKSQLPAANVLVHPRLANDGAAYGFGQLSGSGVAFKLAWALCKRHCGSAKVTPQFREYLLDAVTLAALGTVADVVPLHDENRIFVRYGLSRLRQHPSVGLKALMERAGLAGKTALEAADIAFILAPRLNAAGRLGTARLAVELLTTRAPERAKHIADYLEDQNQQRQTLERRILTEAREQAEARNGAPALVLASRDWHPGLVGIVASRLVDLYSRPVLMIALREEDAPGQGSGRSIPGLRLHETLQECGEDLLSHGGHAAAAGFRIDPPRVESFRQHFCDAVQRRLGPELSPLALTLDAEVPLAALTPGLVNALAHLEPYGAGNPQPLFLAGGLQVVGEPRRLGGGQRHLAFRVRQAGRDFRAIGFGMGDRLEELMCGGGHCCLAFRPRISEWQGYRYIELEARDFQPGPVAQLH